MLRAMVTSTQAVQSTYIALFQLPGLPERLLGALDGRLAARLLRRSGLPEAHVAAYVDRLRDRAAMTAALNWYRAVPLQARTAAGASPITVPTLYVWSTGDVALGRKAAEATAAHVSGPYRFEVLDGVSHWIPEEVPERVVALVRAHASGG
jgi:pimeloyl-ACP methyl ester carboxylesterase